MNKIIQIIALMIVFVCSAQRTAADHLEKAILLLSNDPCDATGLAWVKGALKLDPKNTEAIVLRRNCTFIKVAEAKEVLASKPNNPAARVIIENAIKEDSYFDTEENNLFVATALMERPNHVAEMYIDKLIEFNPNNTNYRWMRVQCNIYTEKHDDLIMAISDLNFIIEKSGPSYNAVYQLADAHYDLAEFYRLVDEKNKYKINLKKAHQYYSEALTLGNDKEKSGLGFKIKLLSKDLQKLNLQD